MPHAHRACRAGARSPTPWRRTAHVHRFDLDVHRLVAHGGASEDSRHVLQRLRRVDGGGRHDDLGEELPAEDHVALARCSRRLFARNWPGPAGSRSSASLMSSTMLTVSLLVALSSSTLPEERQGDAIGVLEVEDGAGRDLDRSRVIDPGGGQRRRPHIISSIVATSKAT